MPDRAPHLALLIALTALSTLSLNLFLPSLPVIAQDFETSYANVSLAIAGYLVVMAVLQLVIGPLSDYLGRRPVILGALLIFTLASLGAMLAQSVTIFLICRMVQAVIVACFGIALAIVRDTTDPKGAAVKIAYISMAMSTAPMLGPAIGGGLEILFGWRASFALFSLLGLLLFLLTWTSLAETNKSPAPTFGAQLRLYPKLFGAGLFWAHALCLTFSTGAFYVFMAGAPLVAAEVFQMSPAKVGIAMGLMSGGFFLGSFLGARATRYWPVMQIMLAGQIISCAALGAALLLTGLGYVSLITVFGAPICAGFGNGLTKPGANAGVLSVRPDLAGTAAGLSGSVGVAGGALMTTLSGLLVSGAAPVTALLALMLASAGIALATVFAARHFERQIISDN